MTPRTLGQLLAAQAAARPGAPAIHAPGQAALTYRELHQQVARLGGRLNTLGVGRGDRVALVLPNGPDLAIAFLAVAVHATAAPLNPALRDREFAFHLEDMGAAALIVTEGSTSPAVEVARDRGIRIIEVVPGKAGIVDLRGAGTEKVAARTGQAGPDETALLLHTSGTTSTPKLVPLTHANLGMAAGNTRAAFDLGPDDVCLNIMPLFHAHGLVSTLLAAMTGGGAVVCTPGFSDHGFFDWLATYRPTWYSAVPTMHQALLAAAGEHEEALRAARLRFVRSASAPLPGPVRAALEDTFRAPVIEAYGMSEAGSLVTSNPLPPGRRKPGSVGLPVGEPVAVLAPDGRVLGPGERGEIAIRGGNVTAGYEHNPETNATAFHDGRLRTGDEGWLDEDGYLYVAGRTKEIINRGGSKVSPAEVDEVLAGHPGVRLAVTFGVEHPTLGEDVAVAVVAEPGAAVTEDEIRAFASRGLADYKVPSRVLFVADVPRTAAGKVRRLALAEMLRAEAAPRPSAELAGVLQQRVGALWAELLGTGGIGPDDNFFDLGGDSLLLAAVAARLRDELGRDLPVFVLTMYPTVRALARHLAGTAEATPEPTRSTGAGKARLLRQRASREAVR